ncbi:MAG TPA: Holliday junction branch migration protein RuvA [Candidatus Omnitrophota bacterium]|nr:Holliday junction branch migration protein RuvA [Candidatus Omnitrophota bacterium]
MIAHISGVLELKDKDFAVIDVSGIGYKVYAPGSTLNNLPAAGSKVKLFTEQVVREDSITLYGFIAKEERNLFNSLLTVSGVGPKSAMSIISSFPLDKLITAIVQGNAALITSVPGIGSKTAQKIIIDLKEKLAKSQGLRPSDLPKGEESASNVISDAISALVTLGYSPREAREAIMNSKADLEDAKTVEDVIKVALKNLS